VSLALGCVRATERWLGEDAISAERLTAARIQIVALLDRDLPPTVALPPGAIPLAVAGTATTLAALDLGLDTYDPAQIDGHVVERDEIAAWIVRLAPLDRDERRRRHPVIEAGRSPVLIGGCLVLLAVLDVLDADAFEAAERDILHGVALQVAV
jgi:exopolyphosphatase/guanosine-5'-triphosphate,3'-diphosphate pyrophosphatase